MINQKVIAFLFLFIYHCSFSQVIDKCFRTIEPNLSEFRLFSQDEKTYKKYLRKGLPGNEYIYGYFQKFIVSDSMWRAKNDSLHSFQESYIDSNEFEGLNKINLVHTGDLIKIKGKYRQDGSFMIPVSYRQIKDSVASFVSFRLDKKSNNKDNWVIYYKKMSHLDKPFKMYIHLGEDKTNEKLKYLVTLPPATEIGKMYSYSLDFNKIKIDKKFNWLCIGYTGTGYIYSECDMNYQNEHKTLNR